MLVLKIEKNDIVNVLCLPPMMFLPIWHLWEVISLLQSFQIAFYTNPQKLTLLLVMKMKGCLETLVY